MKCLGEATMVGFLAGRLDAQELDRVEVHLDGCLDCRRALAAIAASMTRDEAPASAARSWGPLLTPGTRLDHYRVEGLLGEGGMGVVYAARDELLDRRVALKVPSLRAPQVAARFRREAQAMARVVHRNVVTVYGLGSLPGGDGIYIAMELIRGTTARQPLQASDASWRPAQRIYAEAGRGLLAAHQAGLVHRDFKPDNVLVGEDGRVCVSDFGLAAAAAAGAAELVQQGSARALASRITGAGWVLGSPAYMAPEQMRGEPIDARADVFAFSVSLYEGLYGERPFAGDTLSSLQAAVHAGTVREPARASDVPRPAREAVRAGLCEQPGGRPALTELLAALESR